MRYLIILILMLSALLKLERFEDGSALLTAGPVRITVCIPGQLCDR